MERLSSSCPPGFLRVASRNSRVLWRERVLRFRRRRVAQNDIPSLNSPSHLPEPSNASPL